jgi:hemoglobin
MMEKKMLKKLNFIVLACGIAIAGALMSVAATAQERTKIQNEPEIFQAFGGKAGLVAIMNDFMVGLLADKRTAPFFKDTDNDRVKEQLVDQICEILNGGCVYKGAKMKPMHAEMGINREHFNGLVEQLQIAMDKNKVPFRAQNKLLAVLAPMHRDIITK